MKKGRIALIISIMALAGVVLFFAISYYTSQQQADNGQQALAGSTPLTASELEGGYSFIDPYYTNPVPARIKQLDPGSFEITFTDAFGPTKSRFTADLSSLTAQSEQYGDGKILYNKVFNSIEIHFTNNNLIWKLVK